LNGRLNPFEKRLRLGIVSAEIVEFDQNGSVFAWFDHIEIGELKHY
jgi:hypothetical protein